MALIDVRPLTQTASITKEKVCSAPLLKTIFCTSIPSVYDL